VQLRPAARRCGLARSALKTGSWFRSCHANQGGQNEEKTMKIITIALLINAIAELVAAFAKFINAIRHRK
jgi:hypothetical protein